MEVTKRNYYSIALIAIVISLSIISVLFPSPLPEKTTLIYSDSELALQASLHGWSGDGTEVQPFIIANTTFSSDFILAGTKSHIIFRNNSFVSEINKSSVVYLWASENVRLENNLFVNLVIGNLAYGLRLFETSHITVTNNSFSAFSSAIELNKVGEDHEIYANILLNNQVAIRILSYSHDRVKIINNTFIQNSYGVVTQNGKVEIIGNKFTSSGIIISTEYSCSENVIQSNTINDKKILYFEDQHDWTIIEHGAQMIFCHSSYLHINNPMSQTIPYGISLLGVTNSTIDNNFSPLSFKNSNGNTIRNNNIIPVLQLDLRVSIPSLIIPLFLLLRVFIWIDLLIILSLIIQLITKNQDFISITEIQTHLLPTPLCLVRMDFTLNKGNQIRLSKTLLIIIRMDFTLKKDGEPVFI